MSKKFPQTKIFDNPLDAPSILHLTHKLGGIIHIAFLIYGDGGRMTINIKMCENSKFSNRRKHVTIRVIGCLMNKTFDISQITLKKMEGISLNMILFFHFQSIHKILTIAVMKRSCNQAFKFCYTCIEAKKIKIHV
jgi:hypothetical protein